MLRHVLSFATAIAVAALFAASFAAEPADEPSYDLTARLEPGEAADVNVTLEVGGEVTLPATTAAETKQLPLSVAARFAYAEQIVTWSSDPAAPARAVRRYSDATATIKTNAAAEERTLPAEKRTVTAELAADGFAVRGVDAALTRNEFDLLDVEGNSLAIDRLLPGKTFREGEGWDHTAEVIGPLLGMDHVAVCEVRSVVVGEENRQVQIRLAGTVHGTVDGAAAELELRAAYLYHLDRGRISKLNLAIKHHSKPAEAASGLDVVAKLSVIVAPVTEADRRAFTLASLVAAEKLTRAELRELSVEYPDRGYRFRHDKGWITVAAQREVLSLKLIDEGNYLAHCNVANGPPRAVGQPKTLGEFTQEVQKALGERFEQIAAATEWTTPAGNHCLGVFANGKIDDVEMQWRYYYIADEGLPQITTSVTLERAAVDRFADADRPLVDSLELIPSAAQTAAALVNPAASPK
jgi:hypothetical protein